jgi:uncharacterized protein (TIGR03118 family)
MICSARLRMGEQMRRPDLSRRRLVALATTAVAAVAGGGTAGASAMHHGYRQTNLVSDIPGRAQLTDPNLVNPWGLAAGPTTPLWVANNGTGTATLYAGGTAGTPFSTVPLVFTVPMGAPTGQVFNGSNGFKLRTNAGPMPARFIFDSEAGTVSAWTPTTPLQMNARTKLTVPGAIFKGLAIGFFQHHPALYAADFGHSRVWVIDSHFHVMNTPGAFMDPTLPSNYSPFGIQSIGRWVVVTYAKHVPGQGDETDGPGLGFVDVYTQDGQMVARLASHGALNAPWGLVRAPAHFGRFSGALLVGNFGDGHINAYNFKTGQWLGNLRRPNGDPIAINGLWGLRFGNGVAGGPNDLLFSAGIQDEAHGLLGMIRHVS